MSPGPSDAIAAGVADLATEVDATILALLDADGVRWEKVDPQLHAPLASLRRLVMAGGKRLRPAFCYWGFRGAGGDAGDPRIVRAGAALELLHTSALIHDDVIDCSASRRGLEVIHAEFARRHADAAWPGDSERFGEGIAILLGDLAFVYADMLLAGVPAPALAVFDELRLEVNVGQLLDLIGSARRDATVESARRIGRYKSAKYTIERPLHLGAAIADPAGWGRLSGPLSDYGLPLGEAFQLKDDLLGAFGDPARTGKPAGGDIREGKPTLLYALSRRQRHGLGIPPHRRSLRRPGPERRGGGGHPDRFRGHRRPGGGGGHGRRPGDRGAGGRRPAARQRRGRRRPGRPGPFRRRPGLLKSQVSGR